MVLSAHVLQFLTTSSLVKECQLKVTVKPHIPVTLICVDTTDRVDLAEFAIEKCLEQATFNQVKLLTHDSRRKYAVTIPRLYGVAGYSAFIVNDLWRYVESTHCLIVQSDGWIVDGHAWSPRFLECDYIGAPWWHTRGVGNGGFSLRSKRLLQAGARIVGRSSPHPEDTFYCIRERAAFEAMGMRYADLMLASRFAVEGRVWLKNDWVGSNDKYTQQFGFHSWLTPLPSDMDRPNIFHHSGDAGDVIYSLATIKALGGGVLFLSPDSKFPYPRPTREKASYSWADNLAALIGQQDYIWRVQYTEKMPYSVDYDLNQFRKYYQYANKDNWTSLFRLHLKTFGVDYPEDEPWLSVKDAAKIEGRPIIVNRTARFHNNQFPWRDLIKRHGDKMAFVGTMQEHAMFAGLGGNVPWIKTATLGDVARVVAGCKVFIGNQSCPMAIALGIGVNTVIEVWPGNANCNFNRKNQIKVTGRDVNIPEEWLR